MSVNSSLIKCDKCDYTSSMSVVHGLFYYLSDGKEYDLERCRGWCYDCQKFSAIEELEDVMDVVNEIEENIRQAALVENAGFWYKLTSNYKRLKKDYNFNLKQIIALRWRINFISKRLSKPKCLTCGSENIVEIKAEELNYYSDGPDKVKLGFVHPSCNGNLWIVESTLRFNMIYTPRYYDLNGNKIEKDS